MILTVVAALAAFYTLSCAVKMWRLGLDAWRDEALRKKSLAAFGCGTAFGVLALKQLTRALKALCKRGSDI